MAFFGNRRPAFRPASGTGRSWPLAVLAIGATLAATPAFAADDGARIYVDKGCQVCHGGMGEGGVGPGFHDNAFIALSDYVSARILMGGGAMPGFAHRLSDAEIAAVATYLRQKWGNDQPAVTAKEVAAVRNTVIPESGGGNTEQDVGPPP